LEYPFKDKIVCTDYARRKIKYKDEFGNIVDDPEMIKISQKLFQAIEEKNTILINEYISELHNKYNISVMEPNNEMDEIESEHFYEKLNMITNELVKIKKQKREVSEIANGSKNNSYAEFVKDICCRVPPPRDVLKI